MKRKNIYAILSLLMILCLECFARDWRMESGSLQAGYKQFNRIIIVNETKSGFYANNTRVPKFSSVELNDSTYPFMVKCYSDYIVQMSSELQIDSDLVVAILMVENPEFNPDITHRNNNGTNDLGLFQLNDRYCYSEFVKSYWDMNVEFNPYNWKHNAYIAMHHIENLSRTIKVQDDVIMAYNCGRRRVIDNNIPATTRQYLAKVNNNLKLLKNTKEMSK